MIMYIPVYILFKMGYSNFIAGRPKAALLFLFFGGFRCGVWLLFCSSC